MNRKLYIVLIVMLILTMAVMYMSGVRIASATTELPQVSSITSGQMVGGVTSYKFDVQLTTYTVKAGDTLWWIASKNRTTVNSIVILNKLTNTILYPGKQLTIPGTVTVTGYTVTPDQPAPAPQQPQQPPAGSAHAYVYEIQQLVNQERAKVGAVPLTLNLELSKVAQEKARDMAANGYFSHTSPTYGSPFDMMRQFGVRFSYAGENIAKGYTSPASVMQGWMNSPGHKANILNTNYTHLGVGIKDNVWVQMFIKL